LADPDDRVQAQRHHLQAPAGAGQPVGRPLQFRNPPPLARKTPRVFQEPDHANPPGFFGTTGLSGNVNVAGAAASASRPFAATFLPEAGKRDPKICRQRERAFSSSDSFSALRPMAACVLTLL